MLLNVFVNVKINLIETVLENFDKEGLLVHFMAFMNMICTGQLSVMNIAVLLSMEVALLLSLASTTQMRYRNETALFGKLYWQLVVLEHYDYSLQTSIWA